MKNRLFSQFLCALRGHLHAETWHKAVGLKYGLQVVFLGCDKLHISMQSLADCAVSSVVEHYLDTVGVTGSNPVSRTILQFVTRRDLRGKQVTFPLYLQAFFRFRTLRHL